MAGTKTESIIDYEGPMTHGTMEMLLTRLRSAEAFTGIRKPVRKRLYGTFVELIDNIYKYDAGIPEKLISKIPSSMISVRKEENGYLLTAGNVVPNEEIGNLKFNIDRVNELDKEALVNLYEEIINRESTAEDTGAGLGLITMALRTESELMYSFNSLENDYSFFEIQIKITE
jgi:hypothetical protein